MQMVEDCPVAIRIVGSPMEVCYKKNFITCGTWHPPGPGYHGKLCIEGKKNTAYIYYSRNIATMVFYTEQRMTSSQKQPNGEIVSYSTPKEIIIDLTTCKEKF